MSSAKLRAVLRPAARASARRGCAGCARGRTARRRRPAASARAMTRSARAPAWASVSPPGRAVAPQRPARPLLADLRRSCGPRSRRSRARPGPGRSAASKPASSRRLARARSGRARARARTRARRAAAQRARRRAPALGQRQVGRRRVLARGAPLRLAVADEDDPHCDTSAPARAPRPTCVWTGAGPALSSTTNAVPSRDQVVLPADRGAAVVRQRAQRQPGAARVLALHRGVDAAGPDRDPHVLVVVDRRAAAAPAGRAASAPASPAPSPPRGPG